MSYYNVKYEIMKLARCDLPAGFHSPGKQRLKTGWFSRVVHSAYVVVKTDTR
jgi:hypothetical protein